MVHSIEMGGLGPGYEQAIQITVAEVLRHLLEKGYDAAKLQPHMDEIREASFKNETIMKLGLSGAQWGGAVNLASMLYRHGPIGVMKDERVKDRHIMVQRKFPGC